MSWSSGRAAPKLGQGGITARSESSAALKLSLGGRAGHRMSVHGERGNLWPRRCHRYLGPQLRLCGQDRVERVLPAGGNPGGFRTWGRRLHDVDECQLDDAHLMRMAGRSARRVRGWAEANHVRVIFCQAKERKHLIAEQYLAEHPGLGRACSWSWPARRRRQCGKSTGHPPGWSAIWSSSASTSTTTPSTSWIHE